MVDENDIMFAEIYDAVKNINNEFKENQTGCSLDCVVLETDGEISKVKFLDKTIYVSDEWDYREIDEEGKYEPMLGFLKREINEIIDDINLQKLS